MLLAITEQLAQRPLCCVPGLLPLALTVDPGQTVIKIRREHSLLASPIVKKLSVVLAIEDDLYLEPVHELE